MTTKCRKCGQCCRVLIIEINCQDIVNEPKLAEIAIPFRDVVGPCGFDEEGEAVHYDPCHLLAAVKPCPMLGEDNRCTIYSTRP